MRDHDWFDKINLAIVSLTLLFVIIYTIITALLASIASRTGRRQLRAYVNILGGEMTLVNVIEGGKGINIHIEIKNSGQTPAYKFTTWIKEPRILEVDAIPFDAPTPIDNRTGSSIVGPGASVHLNWTLSVRDEEIAAICNHTKQIFVWGARIL